MQVQDLLPRFSQQSVMVLGDLVVEKYVWGTARGLANDAPVPVLRVEGEEYQLGGAANVARHLAALGAQVRLCGLVGYDDAAHALRRSVRQSGIDTSGIFPAQGRQTASKVRVLSHQHGQQLLQLDYEPPRSTTDLERGSLRTYIEATLESTDCLILCDYEKETYGSLEFVQELARLAAAQKVLTVADAHPAGVSLLRDTHLTLVSDAAARDLHATLYEHSGVSRGELARDLLEFLHCGAIVLIDAAEGMLGVRQEGEAASIPCSLGAPFSVLGLREPLLGTLTLCLLAGGDLGLALRVAGRAGAKLVSKPGPASLRPEELLDDS
ncbi:MAG: hypothetical protein HYY96_15445 [Candidatus Tectomicrobia bacterium]|nr:hypothetical protein [Candidatus Tectomicrobia bacterium]